MQRLVGSGWRIRKLINGQYLAEVECGWFFEYWKAVDLISPKFTWNPGDFCFQDCIGSYEKCVEAISYRGFS